MSTVILKLLITLPKVTSLFSVNPCNFTSDFLNYPLFSIIFWDTFAKLGFQCIISYFHLDGMLVYRSVTIQLQHENLFCICQFKKNFFYLLWNNFIVDICHRLLSVCFLPLSVNQTTDK